MADQPNIGFIGLGIMGRPMALNLLNAGYPLIVHNRTRKKEDDLVKEGAQSAENPRAVAGLRGRDHDAPRLARRGARVPGRRRCDCRRGRRAAADRHELDAPVSGGDVGARDGTLSIMVGGPETAFDRARPVFDVLGKTVVRLGGAGAGQTAKACHQILVAVTIEAVSEALVLASKAGVDPERLLEVLSGGLAGNRVMEVRRRTVLGTTSPRDSSSRSTTNHSALLTAIEQASGHTI